jgi:hypothetical protein
MNQTTHSAFDLNHSMLQRTHGKYKPVREFTRLMKDKIANTGFDPKTAFYEFMQNDISRPLSKPRPYLPKIEAPEDKWGLKTTKQAPSIEKVPKLQQYKNYFFPDRNAIDPDAYKSSFLKTDHVSIRIPKLEKKEGSKSFLNLKSQFGPHTETTNPWVPQGNFKTINNRSSVEYNIISHGENRHGGALVVTVSDKKVINKKKGVAEFSDLSRTFHPNFNPRFETLLKDNSSRFYINNGIFSQMYDAAHRNGNIIMPFKNDIITQRKK